ncbi:MAG: DUF1015 family protein [Eubacteriales bacterium]|nr:DUF1015 family protein [Eubacteriales bacterium]MDY3332779.1 DUF1015 family protein [Gallibacter sp.]
MAKIKPFRAVRPSKGLEDRIIVSPFEKMADEEIKKIIDNNPYSFLRVIRADVDLDGVEDRYCTEVFEKAKENIQLFIDDEVMLVEEKPVIYIYRQTLFDHVQTGIVCCVNVNDYENGVIKKHEQTKVDKEYVMMDQLFATSANTEPIFLAYAGEDKIKVLINSYINNKPKEYDVTLGDVRHEIWTITDDNIINGIVTFFEEIDSLYIADGHHRTHAAYSFSKRMHEQHHLEGEYELDYIMATIFPMGDLQVIDFNRVVKNLNGHTKRELLEQINQAGFDIIPTTKDNCKPTKKYQISMYIDNEWYFLNLREEEIAKLGDVVEKLDVSILQDKILAPILGIHDPRINPNIEFVNGLKDMKGLEERVDNDMEVAFAVYPVSIEEIIEISDKERTMPPKSTCFEPKLAIGLFMHRL